MSAELILDGAVKKFKDGREVCCNNAKGNREYKERIRIMWYRQHGICCLCNDCNFLMTLELATFEHSLGRGMGGGHRDDRIWDENGNPMNGAAHGWCNSLKGSKRVTTSPVTPLAP